MVPTIYIVTGDSVAGDRARYVATGLGGTHVMCGCAREYLQRRRVDEAACLILDLVLPDMSGLQLQQQLSTAAPPIIFMGGPRDLKEAVCAMKAGAWEFLTKPLDTTKLLTAMREAVAQDVARRRRDAELTTLRQRLAQLTPREMQVLPLLVEGLRNKEAAWRLGIKEVTVQVHRGSIMRKMLAGSFAQLVRMVDATGIAPPVAPCGESLRVA